MKIDIYQAITVEYDYMRTNLEEDCADLVVYMGALEVHREKDVQPPSMWSHEDYENEQKDRAVGIFAKRLLNAMQLAEGLGPIA